MNQLLTKLKPVTFTRRLEGIKGACPIKELQASLFRVFQNIEDKCLKLINYYPVTQTMCFK
jgi:hypothetical protein